jgi:hypothetical protein
MLLLNFTIVGTGDGGRGKDRRFCEGTEREEEEEEDWNSDEII